MYKFKTLYRKTCPLRGDAEIIKKVQQNKIENIFIEIFKSSKIRFRICLRSFLAAFSLQIFSKETKRSSDEQNNC